jgi:hypothetical protein
MIAEEEKRMLALSDEELIEQCGEFWSDELRQVLDQMHFNLVVST